MVVRSPACGGIHWLMGKSPRPPFPKGGFQELKPYAQETAEKLDREGDERPLPRGRQTGQPDPEVHPTGPHPEADRGQRDQEQDDGVKEETDHVSGPNDARGEPYAY